MQIIWDEVAAEKLKQSHTVLELETFQVEDRRIKGYCVVPAEKVINDIAQLDNLKTLHAEFIKAMNNSDLKLCTDIAEHLKGRFAGELDSFYDIILDRLAHEQN